MFKHLSKSRFAANVEGSAAGGARHEMRLLCGLWGVMVSVCGRQEGVGTGQAFRDLRPGARVRGETHVAARGGPLEPSDLLVEQDSRLSVLLDEASQVVAPGN
jgi:hypothetical protein